MTAKIVSEAEIDRSIVKIILIGFFIIAACFGFAYFLNLFFKTLQFGFLLLGLALAVLALILIILSVFYIKSFNKLAAITFLSALLSLAVFYPDFSNLIIISAFVLFIFLLLAYYRGFKLINNLIQLRFFLVASSILPKALTAFVIFAIIVFFNYYFDIKNYKFNEALNKIFITNFIKITEPIFKIFLDDFSFQSSGDEVIKAIVKKRINNLIPDFDRLLPAVKEKVFNEAFIEFKKNLEKDLGPIEGTKPVSEILFSVVKGYLDNLSENGKLIFAVGFSLFLFFVIKGIAFFFYWLIELMAFVLFKFLIVVGFAYISLENKSREFVILT